MDSSLCRVSATAVIFLVTVTAVSGIPNFWPPNIKNITDAWGAWGRFQNLTGCRMGDHVSGLAGLKQYMNRFGYLNPANNANFSDDFDGSFQSALKTYQKNFNLNASGVLDFATVQQMVRPRCGVADVINGSSSMNSGSGSGKERSNERKLYSFFPGMPMWRKSQLTYSFSTANQAFTADVLRAVYARAFDRWAAVTPLTFTEAATGAKADITIEFYSGDHGDGEPFDGVLGTLAHAFSPPSGIFHLDAAENWVVNGGSSLSGVDLESVAVHEIGHLLGLGHSSVEEAIMYPSITTGTTRVSLAQDDITGIQDLYGSNPNNNGSSTSTSSSPPSIQNERERDASGGVRTGGAATLLGCLAAIVSSLLF